MDFCDDAPATVTCARLLPSCYADVAALGAYRALYLLNWIFRYFTEEEYLQRIVWFAGVVQVRISEVIWNAFSAPLRQLGSPRAPDGALLRLLLSLL